MKFIRGQNRENGLGSIDSLLNFKCNPFGSEYRHPTFFRKYKKDRQIFGLFTLKMQNFNLESRFSIFLRISRKYTKSIEG